MRIKDIIFPLLAAVLLAAVSCSSGQGLEKLALKRMPKALEKAMEEQMYLSGGAKIKSIETIYDCDSLCIIHFQAVAKDPSGKEFSFPVRYIFVRDMFMSAAEGHPVYSEMVTGSPTMDREEVKKLKESCRENSDGLYVYYAGATTRIDSDDLW